MEDQNTYVLPPGDYHLVGWDIDTTGSNVDDEICHIAAYTPASSFTQYVMPYADVKPIASRKHGLEVVTVGRFRMLKDMKSDKVLKTKCLVAALGEFLRWLGQIKEKTSDGVILIFHEDRKVSVPIMIQAVRKFNLMDKFSSVVKGFVNGYEVAEAMRANNRRSVSLKFLAKMLLQEDVNVGSAVTRSRLSFEILQIICGDESNSVKKDLNQSGTPSLAEAIGRFTKTIAQEEKECERFKVALDRQKNRRVSLAQR